MPIKALIELIRIPSCSSKERDIQEHIKTKLEGFGLEPFFQGDNLLVHLKGADSTRAFIFNGHTDVVDPGDLSRWKNSNPWEPVIDNGRIFGRGASDMKAGIYTMMEVAFEMAKASDLATDVWFTFVVKEETDGEGTKSFSKWFKDKGYTKKYKEMTAIFAEPTSLNRVEHGHRGNYFIRAKVDGDAAHSSRPKEIKRHAILLMTQFIQKLELECVKWAEKYKGREFAPPSITPTAIEAKSASPNKTSDCCTACFDLRTVPGFHEKAYDRVKKMAGELGIKLSLIYPEAPVGYTSSEAKIIKVMRTLIPDLKLNVSQAAADLGFLSELGVEGVIFGPGEIEMAHQINESASVDQILAAPALFEKIYNEWAKTT